MNTQNNQKPRYGRSYIQRAGEAMLRKRAPLQPHELTELELLTAIVRSGAAAKTLMDEFGTLTELAKVGAAKGFTRLQGYPAVTPGVICALEAWLESMGRVAKNR